MRGGETMVQQMLTGCLLHPSNWGPGPQPRICALTGNQMGNLSILRLALNPLSHTSQSVNYLFVQITDALGTC